VKTLRLIVKFKHIYKTKKCMLEYSWVEIPRYVVADMPNGK